MALNLPVQRMEETKCYDYYVILQRMRPALYGCVLRHSCTK